jgi:hypothetical protein
LLQVWVEDGIVDAVTLLQVWVEDRIVEEWPCRKSE